MASSLVFEGHIFPGTKFWEEFLKLDLFEVLTWAPPACFPQLCPPRAPVWQSLLEPQLYSSTKGNLSSGSVPFLDLLALRYILRSCPQAPSEMGVHMKHRPVFAGKLVLRTLSMVCATGTGAPLSAGHWFGQRSWSRGPNRSKSGSAEPTFCWEDRQHPNTYMTSGSKRHWEETELGKGSERQSRKGLLRTPPSRGSAVASRHRIWLHHLFLSDGAQNKHYRTKYLSPRWPLRMVGKCSATIWGRGFCQIVHNKNNSSYQPGHFNGKSNLNLCYWIQALSEFPPGVSE